jgi:hypothetical protein
MAYILDLPYEKVPKLLNQCGNPLCVRPGHHKLGKAPPSKRFQFTVEEVQPQVLAESILDSLKRIQPMPELGPENAAEELGVPAIPAEDWAAYVSIAHTLEPVE